MNRLGSEGQGEADTMVNGGGAYEGDEDINSFDYNRFGISDGASCSRCRRKCALKTAIALLCGLCALLSIILAVISYTVFQRIDGVAMVMNSEDLTFRDRLDTFEVTLEKLDKLVRAKEEFISNTVLSWRQDVDHLKESAGELSNRLEETVQSVERLGQIGHRVQALEDATGISRTSSSSSSSSAAAARPRIDLDALQRWSSEANATLRSLRGLPSRLDELAVNVSAAAAENADERDELARRLDEMQANASSSSAAAARLAALDAEGLRREVAERARAAQAAAEAAQAAAQSWRPAAASLDRTVARAEDAWQKGRTALAQEVKVAQREVARLDAAHLALRDDWSRAQQQTTDRVAAQYRNVSLTVDKVQMLLREHGDAVRNITFIQGLPGSPGPKGDRGESGLVGISGPAGAKGDTGVPGDTGPVGPKGEVGERGQPGPIGISGMRGAKGSKGSRGLQGLTGPQGPPGSRGEQGTRGLRGFTGEQGPGGLPGMQGPPGEPYDPRSEACKGFGMYFNGSCYSVSPAKMNWTRANESCVERQSHLVIISSEPEQMWLTAKTMGHFVYIGLHDTMVEDNWEWVDGTKLYGPTFWAEGQPDNWALALNGREDCGGFTFAGRWNDFPCSMELSFVCEKDAETVTE